MKMKLELAMALKARKVKIDNFGNPQGSTPLRPNPWARGCGLKRRRKRIRLERES